MPVDEFRQLFRRGTREELPTLDLYSGDVASAVLRAAIDPATNRVNRELLDNQPVRNAAYAAIDALMVPGIDGYWGRGGTPLPTNDRFIRDRHFEGFIGSSESAIRTYVEQQGQDFSKRGFESALEGGIGSGRGLRAVRRGIQETINGAVEMADLADIMATINAGPASAWANARINQVALGGNIANMIGLINHMYGTAHDLGDNLSVSITDDYLSNQDYFVP